MSTLKSQISTLIQLATIDGDFDGQEKRHILMLGKANGLAEDEIKELVENPVPIPHLSTLTEDDRFEYLYNIVQLMKIDSQVYISEIKYCEDLAEKLGYKRKVISKLSASIYSDPSITANKENLKKAIRKFQL